MSHYLIRKVTMVKYFIIEMREAPDLIHRKFYAWKGLTL